MTTLDEAYARRNAKTRQQRRDHSRAKGFISDGHGCEWLDFCQRCGKSGTLEVVRPGKVQCGECG